MTPNVRPWPVSGTGTRSNPFVRLSQGCTVESQLSRKWEVPEAHVFVKMQSGQDWDKVVIRPKTSGNKKSEPGKGGTATEKKCEI